MKIRSILSTLFIFTFLISCGSNEPVSTNEQMPDWYLSPPNDTEEFFYAAGQAQSSRQGTALRSAQQNATQEMGAKLELKVSALQKSFEEEVQSGADANYASTFSNASEILVNNTMNGVSRDRADCEQLSAEAAGGNVTNRCFVLVRLPVGQARNALDNALSKDEEMYTKFKASKAFDELQNRLHEDMEE